MFIVALVTIAKMCQQLKYPLSDDWISKIWCKRTTDYFSALQRKVILTYATTWLNLKDIMQSEISQSQKDKHYTIPLILCT